MSTPDELAYEHSALLKEQTMLRRACLEEWNIMPAQVARQRQNRLWAIRDRLAAIRSTKGFRQPGS